MGGLIAQRLALDKQIVSRIGHLFLFGTPSTGTAKARYLTFAKSQVRDMSPGSEFITRLRADWKTAFASGLSIDLCVAAGERDAFVSLGSVFAPFSEECQKIVPGDHRTMIEPLSRTDPCVGFVIDVLCGTGVVRSSIDSARLSIERRE